MLSNETASSEARDEVRHFSSSLSLSIATFLLIEELDFKDKELQTSSPPNRGRLTCR